MQAINIISATNMLAGSASGNHVFNDEDAEGNNPDMNLVRKHFSIWDEED